LHVWSRPWIFSVMATMLRRASLLAVALADRPQDLFTSLPGFENLSWDFKTYSGHLDVPGPVTGYDSMKIHYQFHTSQNSPSQDPVVTWHNGGPGSSSISIGLYGEMGVFRIGEDGNYLNPWAWNKVANMLYLESPAGSGGSSGFSACYKGGVAVDCRFDDKTQGEAYAHTLQAFFGEFPEYASNGLLMTGESYFGQYGPNIANYIVNNEPFKSKLNLKGMALGNACWGGNETLVACVGPSEDQVDVDLFYGKALFSPKLKGQIDAACDWPTEYTTGDDTDPSGKAGDSSLSRACRVLLQEMRRQVGPHDVYNVYNNCPNTAAFLESTGKDAGWLAKVLRRGLHNPDETRAMLKELNGGFDWDCLGNSQGWITQQSVIEALHLTAVAPGTSQFRYTSSGPASVTLYPELMKKMHVLFYSGDADSCVPYNGYENMLGAFEDQGLLTEAAAWSPYYTSNKAAPAGYLTKYAVPGASTRVSFATIRLAGHTAPQFMPEAAFVMFRDFLARSLGHTESLV